MLADFLFTTRQQRILALFLLRPTQTFAISDIFERAGGGLSTTQTFIKSLVDAQVLVHDTSRRAVGYVVNTGHPLYPELRQIAIKTFGIQEPIEEVLASLTGTVERAFIFGSIAKGTDRPDSDVDVMVVGDVRLSQAARAMDGLSHRLGREVHLKVYLHAEWDALCQADPVVRAIADGRKLNWISVLGRFKSGRYTFLCTRQAVLWLVVLGMSSRQGFSRLFPLRRRKSQTAKAMTSLLHCASGHPRVPSVFLESRSRVD